MSEKQPVYRLRVSSQFSSSHQLRHYQGKCEELHGHNFSVEAEVQGSSLHPDTHILIDFKELKSKLNRILDSLDHTHLNDLPRFQVDNPSSENLARYIFKELEQALAVHEVSLNFVSVAEKESSRAFYSEI
ncbi:MAG: 6-carboxytetrahydropterin synthase QueD [Desulfohalobiaceae bacterium]|nr:6-carboxytetrahydropterin synthase QueD [Desulfohalobiaceae bacterium]